MRYHLTLVGLAMVLAVLTACRKREEPVAAPPQPKVEPRAESNAPSARAETAVTNVAAVVIETNRPVHFQVKWPVGNRYVYRLDLEQESTNRVSEGITPRVEHLSLGVTYAIEVLPGPGEGGGHTLHLEFLANEMESKMADKILVAFDSSVPATNDVQNPMAETFRRVVGSTVQLEVDQEGRVGKVLGLDAWAQKVIADDHGAAGHILAQQFNEGFFRQLADFGRGLSPGAVMSGQSWPYHTELPAGALGKIEVQSTITFVRWDEHDDRRVAVLESRGTLRGLPASGPRSDAPLSLDRGTVTGTSWFDPELGALVESEVMQSMVIKGEIPGETDGSRPAMSFTSDIGQKVAVKLAEFHPAR